MKTPCMTRLLNGTYKVTFPYDPTVVDAINRIMPAHSRSYDPDEKAWHIAAAYKDVIHQLLVEVFIEVEWDVPQAPEGDDVYRALHLLPTAPKELCEAAYKTLSKLYHPDTGTEIADAREMQKINQAIFRIRKEVAS